MEIMKTIYIPNPTKELVSFIEDAQRRKKECIKEMREKLFNARH